MYPAGASEPHKVMDMSGNMWEWQSNLHSKKSPYPALRGGAWRYNMGLARVAARSSAPPARSWSDDGFRVVGAAPVSL